ncbi:protein GVQW3 [Trichonephila clavipes]|nr:protein GVQW3 [Trichonephila clavipes]
MKRTCRCMTFQHVKKAKYGSEDDPMPKMAKCQRARKKSECLSRARVFEWFKRFKDGRQDIEDDSWPGRLSTSKTDENVEKVASLIWSDRRLSIRAIAETVNIDKECVRQILHDNLNMQKVCAKMVPKILTFEQQATRKNVCTDILDVIKNDPNLLEKRFLAKHSIPVLEHPPYSPDLAPCDFYLFPKVKSALKGTRFESVEAVKENAAGVLKELTKDDFQHCFQQWKIRMERCRDREGVYIEGDNK